MVTASPALTRCWRHLVACALITQEMAANISFDPDAAYTAGLLHDIGRFARLGCWPKEYAHLLTTCHPADQLEREIETLGVAHTDAGAFLLLTWNLPLQLAEVAGGHHGHVSESRSSLVKLVSRGCHLADALGFTATEQPVDDDAQSDSEFAALLARTASAFELSTASTSSIAFEAGHCPEWCPGHKIAAKTKRFQKAVLCDGFGPLRHGIAKTVARRCFGHYRKLRQVNRPLLLRNVPPFRFRIRLRRA